MKPRNHLAVLISFSAGLTGLASAHPGSHATTSSEAATASGLHHFLTSPFHIGTMIVALALLVLLLRCRAASRCRE